MRTLRKWWWGFCEVYDPVAVAFWVLYLAVVIGTIAVIIRWVI